VHEGDRPFRAPNVPHEREDQQSLKVGVGDHES
jgi:hypothetical protein